MDKKTSKKIKKYWLKDLTHKEIGLLVSLSERTVKREVRRLGLQSTSRKKPLAIRAYELKTMGYSFAEISNILGICKSTAFTYIKSERLKLENKQK